MTVDITKRSISMEKLDAAIASFKEKKKVSNVYLFMNIDTASAMTLNHDFNELKTNHLNYSTSVFDYCGCRVYLDERLKYGEVELR